MTHPIYESIQLTAKSLNRLKGIYKSLACTIEIKDKRRRQDWINAILNHQSDKTGHTNAVATELYEKPEISTQLQDLLEREICRREYSLRRVSQANIIRYASPVTVSQPKTCGSCALFKPFADGTSRGLCCGSDTVSRDYHPQTGDCLHMIEAADNLTARLPEGSFIFKPVEGSHAYEVWVGNMNYGAIRILENGQWVQSYAPVTTQYGTPYAAAAALVEAAQLRNATEVISHSAPRRSHMKL